MPKDNKYGYEQEQLQIQETLHSMELALDSFYNTLEPLEENIGKMGYYSDWDNRRQIYRKTIEDSNDTAEGFEDLFLTNLFVVKTQIRKKSDNFRKKIKQEFYKWIDAAGINTNNCPEKLKHFLFEINEVLEGRGDNIVNQTRELIKDKELTPQEVRDMYGQLNHHLNKGREREEILKGKKWDYDLGEKGEGKIRNGNPDRGKEILEQICREITSRHGSYDLFSEQKKARGIQEVRWDLIIDFQHNKDNWEIRKNVAITYDRYGGEKKGDILILKSANLSNRDYNQATGELINQPGKVYRQDYFNEKELEEVNAIFAVSTSTNQTIRWDLVNSIKQKASEFKIEKVFVPTQNGYEEEEWIIHNSVERKSDEKGGLIFDSNNMFKIKDLTESEKVELGIQKSESQLQDSSSQKPPKGGKDGGFGGYGSAVAYGSLGIISLIGLAFVNKF